MNTLQKAMVNANLEELDAVADEIGRQAVAAALSPPVDEAQRQRDLDAMLADADQVVRNQRDRLGRRNCTVHDGTTIRRVFEALRGMLPPSNSGDPGFP